MCCGVFSLAHTNFQSLGENESLFNLPAEVKKEDDKLKERVSSFTTAFILIPLAHIRDEVLADQEAGIFRKGFTVTTCAVLMAVLGIAGCLIETIARLAVAIFTSPLLLFLLCAEKEEPGIAIVPAMAVLSVVFNATQLVFGGPLMAYEAFSKEGNLTPRTFHAMMQD